MFEVDRAGAPDVVDVGEAEQLRRGGLQALLVDQDVVGYDAFSGGVLCAAALEGDVEQHHRSAASSGRGQAGQP
jgi:hypothetical protein